MILEIFQILFAVGALIYVYLKWRYKYWERMSVQQGRPRFPFGDMENPFSRKNSFGVFIKKQYDEFKRRGCKHGGIYNFFSPVYIPVDPDYIKNLLQKDFGNFSDRGWYHNERDDPLSAHLFAIGGQKWKRIRAKLTPTFTSGKMKMMIPILIKSSEQMIEALNNSFDGAKTNVIDIKDVTSRFTMDVIGTCAFGLNCNSFKNRKSEFMTYGKRIFGPLPKFKAIQHIFATANPELGNKLGITLINKESTNFFFKVIKETIGFRKQNQVKRNDMLQLLMRLQNEIPNQEVGADKINEKPLTLAEVAAQAFLFFVAGFETSSTMMTYCLYELSVNIDIQEKVRNEINAVIRKYNGKITYESVTDMTYLGQVIDETLRKWPPVPFITRKCVKDYTVPDTNVKIVKGTLTYFAIMGLQRDPEFFPDPDNFDPERFSEENRKEIRPFTYMPFGEGPRTCLGLRFGLLQSKVGLTHLLTNYKFTLNRKTKTPIEADPYGHILAIKGTVWLDAEKIK